MHAKQVPVQRLRAQGRLIPVESAFGGFGIYLLRSAIARRYDSSAKDRCEHVAFNRGLRLAVMPELELAAPSEHLGDRTFPSPGQLRLVHWARSVHPLPRPMPGR